VEVEEKFRHQQQQLELSVLVSSVRARRETAAAVEGAVVVPLLATKQAAVAAAVAAVAEEGRKMTRKRPSQTTN
jgi:hypothetical protein